MKKNKGFTLIELLVVIAIIGVLAAIILASLSSANAKGNDSKIESQVKSMANQAQLYAGATTAVAASTTAVTGVASGTLFSSTTTTDKSLFMLINKLPGTPVIYYAYEGTKLPFLGGKWAFAATTSTGAACNDYTGVLKKVASGTALTATTIVTTFPNIAASYSCN